MTVLLRRVPRTNGGKCETTQRFPGVADRVQTPVRGPRRGSGTDTIDLSWFEYDGVQAP